MSARPITPQTGTQSIDRAAQLLVHVLETDVPPTVGELSVRSGLPKSTTSRLVGALERQGLVQRAPAGHFRPIGSDGFFPKGQRVAQFDQQPLEAQSMVSAAIEAFRATHDPYWMSQARLAFEWYTGRNDLGQPVCDPSTGACCDGLHADRVNQNQGAESTLAYLLALAEMQLLENSLTAFRKAAPVTVG